MEVYKDARGQYRWRLKAGNGRVVADSGESYSRREDAERAARRLRVLAAFCKVESL